VEARRQVSGEQHLSAVSAAGFPLVAPRRVRQGVRATAPTFAVVVAAYNCERSIGETLESALAQTHAPQQVIVCDDGSTDDTARIVAAFEPDVTLIRQENAGDAAARNAALALATTSHVVILDSDDLLERRCYEAYAAALAARPDLEIVTCDAFLETDGVVFDRYYRRAARFVVDDQRRGALHQHFVFGLACISRERVVAVGGWDTRYRGNSDTDLFLRLILAGSPAGLVYEPLARYRFRPDSLSDERASNMRAMVTIVERALEHPSLSDDERAYARSDLQVKERLACVAELEHALQHRAPDARRRAWCVALGSESEHARRVRLLAAVSAIAPPLGRVLLRFRDRRSGITPFRVRTRRI
jgi:glycosyltransferase involved in cell wall biosynthesis